MRERGEDDAMMLYRKRVALELQEQHFGVNKVKRRVLKPSDKFRFSFDWPLTDDTSRASNVLSESPPEAQLQFGRGFRAGMDRLEQKTKQLTNLAKREPSKTVAKGEISRVVYDSLDMPKSPHWSEKKLHQMTGRDWRIFQEDLNISYKGSHVCIRPMRSWEESGLIHELLKAVQKAGYKNPSPIQMATIPLGLAHRDAIGIAETGSGKTASFVLPMLNHISKLPRLHNGENETQGPYALVMAPTRELAQQIKEETLNLSRYLKITVISIVGGHSIEEQGMKLSQGCEMIIATPGRLLDCLDRKYVVFNQCNYVVLDEADRMIDMGFEKQVVGVLNALLSSTNEIKICRTTCMFSATMPSGIKRLARRYLSNPVVINVGTVGKAADLVTQQVIMVQKSEKLTKLQALLDGHNQEKLIMVFVNSRDSAYTLVRQLERQGYRATSLHGGMTQEQREASLKGFKSRQFNCLVATDVAARGIDIHGVARVVNYEMPDTIDKYTHRIGRTGRAGNTGFATTFLTLSDTQVFYDLKQMLIQSNSPVPPELARHEASKVKPATFADC